MVLGLSIVFWGVVTVVAFAPRRAYFPPMGPVTMHRSRRVPVMVEVDTPNSGPAVLTARPASPRLAGHPVYPALPVGAAPMPGTIGPVPMPGTVQE